MERFPRFESFLLPSVLLYGFALKLCIARTRTAIRLFKYSISPYYANTALELREFECYEFFVLTVHSSNLTDNGC